MSTIRKKVASALSFAHLTGFAKASDTDDEKDRRDDAEEDDPEKKDPNDDKGGSKKSKKAEQEEKDKDKDSAEDDDLDEDDDKKSTKGGADDDEPDAEDDDDEEEMRGKGAAAAGRRRERARCAAIFASQAAGKNPALAANLAFNTSMTRKEALAVLENTPAAITPGAGRAARNPQVGIGGGTKPSPQQALAARWDQNLQAANPSRRG